MAGNNVIPAEEKQKIESALAQDARTVSDQQMRQYLSEKSFDPAVGTAIYDINQVSRNRALLAALLAIGLMGLMGFVFSIFRQGAPKTRRMAGAMRRKPPRKGRKRPSPRYC